MIHWWAGLLAALLAAYVGYMVGVGSTMAKYEDAIVQMQIDEKLRGQIDDTRSAEATRGICRVGNA